MMSNMINMINANTIATIIFLLASMPAAEARLNRDKTTDVVDEMHLTLQATRNLKAAFGASNKGAKTNKNEFLDLSNPPSSMPSTPEEATGPTIMPTWISSARPTADPTSSPTSSPTMPPAPSAPPMDFDSTISVACKPNGATILTPDEARPKTIICNSAKPSCREAVAAVKESNKLQNFFACAGDLGEGAARKLFNKYATDDVLAEQLTMIAATNAILVTGRPDAMKVACAATAAMQSPAVADPCCQGSSGCTSATASASSSPPFMTIAITGCTGDSACKNIGPNPLILDSSCTGMSACESMNENDLNPSVVGVTFVGEASCTNPGSCEGVGHRSYGNVIVLDASCVGPDACNAGGRRSQQKTSNRSPNDINIGPNACLDIDACKDTHSTVNHGTAGKTSGSLTIGDGSCTQERSCEKMGFNDRMGMDIIVAPGECSVAGTCRGCITAEDGDNGGAYLISNTDGACPKEAISSGGNPTGKKVEEYCIGRDSLPTETPTFSPTPLPTITRRPTSTPTSAPMPAPMSAPTTAPTSAPTPTPASFTVGCLAIPGDDSSTFNEVTGDVFCDGASDTCANFVSMVDASGDKGKMIKSIFGCSHEGTPNVVTQQVAQKRFDTMKNDADVTQTLLDVVDTMDLYTGTRSALETACAGLCCVGSFTCSTSPSAGVMTVTDNSCTSPKSCNRVYPDTIILDSCKTQESVCKTFGAFWPAQPNANVDVGYRVIGPNACFG